MTIDVNTEGSYRLHLDFILELATSENDLTYHFQEKQNSIVLTVYDKKEKPVYEYETNFLDKRRSIENFITIITKQALIK
jgi:hypothetical protein